jgi:hypothetical protein
MVAGLVGLLPVLVLVLAWAWVPRPNVWLVHLARSTVAPQGQCWVQASQGELVVEALAVSAVVVSVVAVSVAAVSVVVVMSMP